MLHCYGIDIVPLHDDRVGAIFSRIIDKISNSRSVICQYASYVPLHSPSFPSPLRPSRHVSVLPVTSPSPSSLCFTYRSLSSSIVSPSFVFRLFLRYGSIPPLLCSEHHFSDLWLRYHSLTSSHSCGWTISLLSS